MKQILMTLALVVAMLTGANTASAQKVYLTPNAGAVAYHKQKDCSYLKNCKVVNAVTLAEAKEMGRHACVRCYGQAAADKTKKEVAATKKKAVETKKAAEKKVADSKKAAEKKVADAKKAADKKVKETKKAVKKEVTATKKAAKRK